MAKDRDSDAAAQSGQSKRPPLNHHVSHDSDSQVSDHASQPAHHRPKHHKHLVGGGRLSSRVPSSKTLHKSHHAASNAKLNNLNNNNNNNNYQQQQQSRTQQQPLSPDQPERPPMLAATHRRTTSDVRLTRDSSTTNLKKNTSHTSLKRNKSHVEVGKKSKSTANIKRVSSHKDVSKDTSKLKSSKGAVHFDLGTDGQDDEWVDASASASPYLSRRGSVVSSGQGSAKPHDDDNSRPQSAVTPTKNAQPTQETPDRERVQHKEYLTSRLLQRTPSHGAPPKMSSDTAQMAPRPTSPKSPASQGSSTPYDSPKAAGASIGTSGDELTSRFVSGPASGYNPDSGSFFTPSNTITRVKRPQSLGNLHQERRSSADDHDEDDDESALAPRTRKRSGQKATPADTSRTQQKLNLQRASSSMEPAPAGGAGLGAVGASPLLGGAAYDNRDPRIGKLIERTGQEYLVVRRYQNPVARSITRLTHLPGANKQQHIPKQNGANGSVHSKKPSDLAAARQGQGSATPKRNASVRLNGANSIYEAEGVRGGLSGSSYVEGEDDGVAALLRNLWDKNMDLSASQD